MELESKTTPYLWHYHRSDDATRALSFLQAIASSFEKSPKPNIVPFMLILSSSPTMVLVLGLDDAPTKAVGKPLESKLGVKGSGKGVRWDGKWVGVWKDASEGETVKEVLASVSVLRERDCKTHVLHTESCLRLKNQIREKLKEKLDIVTGNACCRV